MFINSAEIQPLFIINAGAGLKRLCRNSNELMFDVLMYS
jgi:hypothetical protein